MSNSPLLANDEEVELWTKDIIDNDHTLSIELYPRDKTVYPYINLLHMMSFFNHKNKTRYTITVKPVTNLRNKDIFSIGKIQYREHQPTEQYTGELSKDNFNRLLTHIEDTFDMPINEMTYGIVDYV